MTTSITAVTPGSYTARALAAIPGYAEQVELVETLGTWQLHTVHSAETICDTAQFEAEIAAQIVEAARTGQPVPELTGSAREHLTARDAHRQIMAAHAHAVRTAEAQLATMERDGVSFAYGWLREQLGELFTAFDELDIDPNLTAERALHEGRGAAYTSATELADSYLSLRNAHRQIVHLDPASAGHEKSALSHKVAVCGQFRNFIDADPFWVLYRRTNARQATDATATGRAHKQWLTAAPEPFGKRVGGSPKAPRPDGIAPMAWMAHVAVNKPWLPDAATLIEAYDLAAAAVRPGRPAVIDYQRYWWITPSTKTHSGQQFTARDALAELANSAE
ncbi:hypothetical protein [Mycobacteroides abscessus]|uniref:hypothetical protein n=1 Tax=Mycobacteroides abscessus TaxID=36809 RepID=UPI0005DF3B0B|nr:hypothetical protein [Mycobacteroides abscessus]CPS10229.1 Uncharacterised protein [Mycobacteroides abscessus]CPS26399.1 Uncharacterised protein [Mycobacteroides abscessus]CPS28921.1 Uncharacterised protein [Mycobacteroides abscessus]CPT09752.1 Uncharacterised protein [Mycobacteroides abscessus]CPT29355.1 Uncharacterised protein [Mycobacteroides abscessus]